VDRDVDSRAADAERAAEEARINCRLKYDILTAEAGRYARARQDYLDSVRVADGAEMLAKAAHIRAAKRSANTTAEPDVAKRSAKPSSPVPPQNEGEGAK
jgi:hypothetical protein